MNENQKLTEEPGDSPRSSRPTGSVSITYEELKEALCDIKDGAADAASASVPEGYEDLDGDPLRIADECFNDGLKTMEGGILNWLYDRLNSPNVELSCEAESENKKKGQSDE